MIGPRFTERVKIQFTFLNHILLLFLLLLLSFLLLLGLQIRVRIGKLFSLFLIQNMLWVLKRTVSMRRFF